MTHYQVTLNAQTLQRLFSSDSQLAHLLESILNQVLEAQISEQLQADRYERTEERQGYRNGYKPRHLTTRVGTLTLRVPQVREGGFSPDLFARYQRSEQALMVTLMEMVVNGVSTRKVARITEELCGREFSKSTVSELSKSLDPLVEAWNERDLSQRRYPFLIVDALVVKVREGSRVRSCSALIASGINEDGYREILGLQLGDSESEHSWVDFFRWLKGRGLSGVDLVVSDNHGGLTSAVRIQFQGASWQRCQMHLSANISSATPKPVQEELHARVLAIFEAPDLPTARTLLAQVVAEYEPLAPTAVATLERGFDDATAVLALPRPYRKRLRTTNGQERLNEEIRRRERVIRIFPNRQSTMRLLGALLMEQDEQWSTGNRYFDMTAYWQWQAGTADTSTTTAERQPVDQKEQHVRQMSYHERYLRGEHEQVWADLLAVGEQVREEPLYTDARAVAHETMRRVQHNLALLVPRLRDLGYAFGYTWAVERGSLTPAEAVAMEQHEPVLSPPPEKVGQFIDEVERRFGLLPLSLRAFYEVCGGVNFVGSHPAWGAYGLDALVVESAGQVVELDDWMHWSDDKDARGACELPIAPDEHHKYFVSGNSYTIRVPAPAADVLLEGEWHHTTFVNYVRTCFRWGGFPGWGRRVAVPEQVLAVLRQDLVPI